MKLSKILDFYRFCSWTKYELHKTNTFKLRIQRYVRDENIDDEADPSLTKEDHAAENQPEQTSKQIEEPKMEEKKILEKKIGVIEWLNMMKLKLME